MARNCNGTSAVTLVLVGVLFSARPALASPITLNNADFEIGNLVGWTLFTTPNGTAGSPTVVPFDTTGAGSSNAARFLVGQVSFVSGSQQGGGLYQDFVATGGALSFHADIASTNQTIFNNGAGGLFSMLLDGVSIASFDFGPILSGATERSTLSYVGTATAGTHELRFLITRPFLAGPPPGGTPYQFIDNVRVLAVPEPATLALLCAGLALVGIRARWSLQP